jgi:hypothetical protein
MRCLDIGRLRPPAPNALGINKVMVPNDPANNIELAHTHQVGSALLLHIQRQLSNILLYQNAQLLHQCSHTAMFKPHSEGALMRLFTVCICLISFGCNDKSDDTGAGTGTDADADADADADDVLSLSTCSESYDDSVPSFYSNYFACVDASMDGDNVAMWTDGLPPTPSAYYPEDDPNYVEFDDRGGTHSQIRGATLGEQSFTMTVPLDPTPKGITIDASLVDNTMNTNDEEYSGGSVGISLNGVIAFAAMARPGDDLADEQTTFDTYEGHPAGTTYHYHFNTMGPLEVLVDRGYSDNAAIGAGSVEMYALMCDGTAVLGCTELDGGIPDDADFDAQNGHVHDISDADGVQLENRYHTHVCSSKWPDYPFFPEIAYYDQSGCPTPGP